jgi:hypothetical protein
MALVVVWNASEPANANDPRQGALEMRNIRAGTIERALQGGIFWENSGTIDQEAGRIVTGVQGIGAELLRFYESDRSTQMADWDSTAGARKLTLGDGKTGVRPYKIVCNELDCNVLTATTTATLPASAVVVPTMVYNNGFTVGAGGDADTLSVVMPGTTTGNKVLLLMSADAVSTGAGESNSLTYKFTVDRGTGSFVAVPRPGGGGSDVIWSVNPQVGFRASLSAHQVDDLGSINEGTIKYAVTFTNSDPSDAVSVSRAMFTVLNLANT